MGWLLLTGVCMLLTFVIWMAADKWIKNTRVQYNVESAAGVLAMVCIAMLFLGSMVYADNHRPEVLSRDCQRIELDTVTVYWHEESKTLYCRSFDFWQIDRNYQLRPVVAEDAELYNQLSQYSSMYSTILEYFPR